MRSWTASERDAETMGRKFQTWHLSSGKLTINSNTSSVISAQIALWKEGMGRDSEEGKKTPFTLSIWQTHRDFVSGSCHGLPRDAAGGDAIARSVLRSSSKYGRLPRPLKTTPKRPANTKYKAHVRNSAHQQRETRRQGVHNRSSFVRCREPEGAFSGWRNSPGECTICR